jgi:hypothetical protein
MAGVSADRQGLIVFWCIGALVAAAAILAIAGETRWPQWVILSSSVVLWTIVGYVRRSPSPSTFMISFLCWLAAGLSIGGVIGLLGTRL